ncbi:MAG: M24 family metallopeptidase [Chloroherpetonaceae bacterium]|nr:M24 family metallopeptidase [Chloroherpetonaceae bacterium]
MVGSGENSVILHYDAVRKKMRSGELVVMDMAGEYEGYASDVTRTIPVSGKFSPEQRAIYELVLKAQEAAIAECRAGNPFHAPHLKAVEVIADGLLKLGIIQDRRDYRRYFMHGSSHHVGLDVHDPSFGTLGENQVITVEPGIYIAEGSLCDRKWWNIGVRIEDVVLITKDGPRVLSAALPKNPDAIETLMQQRGLGNLALPTSP